MGFTDHTVGITYGGVVYESEAGYMPSAISYTIDTDVSDLDITGLLDSGFITQVDIELGKYDYAEIIVYLINYMDTSMGHILLKKGWLGAIEINNDKYTVELLSLMEALHSSEICNLYSPSCRAILGDTKCGINLSSYTTSGTVSSVSSSTIFNTNITTKPNDYYNNGLITWISGDNIGETMEVKDYTQSSGIVTIFLPMPYTVVSGDTFTIHPGCDKSLSTCSGIFSNVINFRGEPFLPGTGDLLEYAKGSKSYQSSVEEEE
jgi:uncharacterized phage protein (TIGR02218 family)